MGALGLNFCERGFARREPIGVRGWRVSSVQPRRHLSDAECYLAHHQNRGRTHAEAMLQLIAETLREDGPTLSDRINSRPVSPFRRGIPALAA